MARLSLQLGAALVVPFAAQGRPTVGFLNRRSAVATVGGEACVLPVCDLPAAGAPPHSGVASSARAVGS
jgi:hypothetical protein